MSARRPISARCATQVNVETDEIGTASTAR
jgi:hypothetical protein